jgi:uncharacterized membrane protein
VDGIAVTAVIRHFRHRVNTASQHNFSVPHPRLHNILVHCQAGLPLKKQAEVSSVKRRNRSQLFYHNLVIIVVGNITKRLLYPVVRNRNINTIYKQLKKTVEYQQKEALTLHNIARLLFKPGISKLIKQKNYVFL